ncbi:hypothetical protein QYE76_011439 [Lolium multiflorum]|uniref:Very-long-chain aldehyde decarbonylase CER1-like C-terminal domain-containing protein n=1 Tax=Lolium multiflorum TaxID=4521 RepID=A0AAD8X5A1_LOLMU|nr:hypothetical protein QYE76_011439 [Lolium multiflorum]
MHWRFRRPPLDMSKPSETMLDQLLFNRDDQIILSAILLPLGAVYMPGEQHLPLWRTDGAVLLVLLHAGPAEFLYYWFHRTLHHHFLYTRYHHASIVTEPITYVVHLTHLTSLQSIYHIRTGFAQYASKPYNSMWQLQIMWPVTWLFMVLTWAYGSWFTVERNVMKKLRMQSWAIPRYSFNYGLNQQKEAINYLIEKTIYEADKKGKYPKLGVRLVDVTSLAAAVVINSIPQGTNKFILAGKITKVACTVASVLCKKNVEVWLIGEGLDATEHSRAQKGTQFIPYSQFPPRMQWKDCCTYSMTPAMSVPKEMQNVH